MKKTFDKDKENSSGCYFCLHFFLHTRTEKKCMGKVMLYQMYTRALTFCLLLLLFWNSSLSSLFLLPLMFNAAFNVFSIY